MVDHWFPLSKKLNIRELPDRKGIVLKKSGAWPLPDPEIPLTPQEVIALVKYLEEMV